MLDAGSGGFSTSSSPSACLLNRCGSCKIAPRIRTTLTLQRSFLEQSSTVQLCRVDMRQEQGCAWLWQRSIQRQVMRQATMAAHTISSHMP